MHTTSTRPFCAFSLRAFARSATLSGVAAVILGVTAPFASAARPDLLMAGASVQGNSYTVTKSLLGPPGISGPDRFEFVGEKKLQDLFFFQDGDGSGTLSSATFVGVGGVKLMANTSAFADTPVASFQFATVSLERLRTQVIRVTGSGALTITVVQGTQTATKTAEIIAPGPASRGGGGDARSKT